jgi:formylglycine-generating enzyme required for sulfatase activity
MKPLKKFNKRLRPMKTSNTLLGILAVTFGVLFHVPAQTTAGLSIQTYAGINIAGLVGTVYSIQFTTNLLSTNVWLTLTNLALPSSPYLWVDTSSPVTGQRFYRTQTLTNTSMVLIPAGSFTMGDAFAEGNTYERPTHSVYVSAFYLEKNLVTKGLWDQVRFSNDGNGYGFNNPGLGKATNHPVYHITWFEAVKWCNARSEMEGLTPCYYTNSSLTTVYRIGSIAPYMNWNANGYRLPTEVEWEKATRGGFSGQRYPWSDTITHSKANYRSYDAYAYLGDLSPTRGYNPTYNDGVIPYTSPVGAFAANGYGLYDMAGNVAEWCWDWFDSTWYGNAGATQADTRGPTSVPSNIRVVRSGSWDISALSVRCASRAYGLPADTSGSSGETLNYLGFRCVRKQ